MGLKGIMKKFDFYSNEVKLNIGKQRTRYSTFVGGIFGILTISVMFLLSFYFIKDFLNSSNVTITSNEQYTNDLLIDYHDFPIMFRLSNTYSQSYSESERLWGINMLWYSVNNTIQTTNTIKMEKCDINKHFGIYKSLFVNISDLNTYYCLGIRLQNQTIKGIYGDNNYYSYYHFPIHYCTNSTKMSNCFNESFIRSQLSSSYLDVKSLDYNLNNSLEAPSNVFLRSDRHSLSSSVYKRIWMYLQTINYNSDNGLITPTIKQDNFFMLDNFRYDVDLRDISTTSVPWTFCSHTITNYSKKKIFFRSNSRIQDLLASIGGITEIVMFLFYYLNYIISDRLYTQKLVNSTFHILEDEDPSIKPKTILENVKLNMPIKKLNHCKNPIINIIKIKSLSLEENRNYRSKNPIINIIKNKSLSLEENRNYHSNEVKNPNDSESSGKSIENKPVSSGRSIENKPVSYLKRRYTSIATFRQAKKRKEKRIIFKWYEYLLPLLCLKDSSNLSEIFIKSLSVVYEKMNVIYMVNKFGELENLKSLIFSQDQKLLFSLLPSNLIDIKNIPSDSEIEECQIRLNHKPDQTEIETKLLKMMNGEYF